MSEDFSMQEIYSVSHLHNSYVLFDKFFLISSVFIFAFSLPVHSVCDYDTGTSVRVIIQ